MVLRNEAHPERFCVTQKSSEGKVGGQAYMFEKDVIEFKGTYHHNSFTYGKIELLETKRTYEGDLFNMMADGEGKLVCADGTQFEGLWLKSMPYRGTLSVKD